MGGDGGVGGFVNDFGMRFQHDLGTILSKFEHSSRYPAGLGYKGMCFQYS